jgi:hypothetical protein
MDLARLRFGDWVMGIGGIAVLAVMFLDWYEPAVMGVDAGHNAWESFAVNDVILAFAALAAVTSFVLTALQPTAALPLALSSLASLPCALSLILVTIRMVWPPDISTGEAVDTARLTGAWLGLVATTLLTGGCLASIRDERLPRPEHPVEPRLVQP